MFRCLDVYRKAAFVDEAREMSDVVEEWVEQWLKSRDNSDV